MNGGQADLASAKKRMPEGFDWVSARARVRDGAVFKALVDRIEEDVRRYEAWGQSKCEFTREDESVYVSAPQNRNLNPCCSVYLELVYKHRRSDPYISVRATDDPQEDREARPALQRDGEILIEIEGHPPLALWQFSRLVLEPVLFPNPNSEKPRIR